MRCRLFQVDAFTDRVFSGNPAAVMVFEEYPADSVLQDAAAENNLSETAFVVRNGRGDYRLRWFTPTTEVALCGHATLASAAVVLERLEPQQEQVVFQTLSGPLTVSRGQQEYRMDFPARPSEPIPVPRGLAEALGAMPLEVFANSVNYVALIGSPKELRELRPDMGALLRLAPPQHHGVIVTCAGDSPYDFLSRYFAPAIGVPEDPVTGAAHCALAPYWARRTGKHEFLAFQASQRGGAVGCRVIGDRVELRGSCCFYLGGEVRL